MSNLNEVTQQDLHDLLDVFEKKSAEAGPCELGSVEQTILKKCENLMKLDYSVIELDNVNGVLSPRYPAKIFIPEYENSHNMMSTLTATNAFNVFGHQTQRQQQSLQHQQSVTLNGSGGYDEMDTSSPATALTAMAGIAVASAPNGQKNLLPECNGGLQSFVTFAMPPHSMAASNDDDEEAGVESKLPPAPTPHPPPPTQSSTIYESDMYDISKIRDLIGMAKYARCRQRFAVPVLMYRGKYICRSATISVMPETYGRRVYNYAYECINGTTYADRPNNEDDNGSDTTEESLLNHMNEPSPFTYDEVIKSDIQLLNTLNVATIVDLMVEMKKIKYFMAVSSSEKADPENHYEDFNILSLPYPGCEFFRKFRDNNYVAKNLRYNWKPTFNDAEISVPKLGPASDLDIGWCDYKSWDLMQITQNYLKAILKYIQEESTGLLIHCISGWDRTPLFVSLVRLSLWADGLIHQNLTPIQMTYFTVAYDWFLFGHQLPDRLRRGEEIMLFCFQVLKHIVDDEFSIVEVRKHPKTCSSSGSSIIVLKTDSCDEEPLKEDYVLNFDQDSNDSFTNNFNNCDMSITDNFFANTIPITSTSSSTSSTNALNNASVLSVNPLTSRSPNLKRTRTSPISVPGSGSSVSRQRQESTSSNGSWQVVTDTGSIDSMMNGSYMMRFISQQQESNSNSSGSVPSIPASSVGGGSSGGGSSSSGGRSSGGGVSSNCAAGNINNGCSSNNGSARVGAPSVHVLSNGYGPVGPTMANGSAKENQTPADVPPAIDQDSNCSPQMSRKLRLNAVRAIFIQAYGKTVGLKFKEGSSMNLTTFIGNLTDHIF